MVALEESLIRFPEPITHIDNEYSRAGIQDPKIVITTSRDPSSKLLQFAKVRPTASQPVRDLIQSLTGNEAGLSELAPNQSRKLRYEGARRFL